MEKIKNKEELLEYIRSFGFHISDGIGDTCSGDDEEAEVAAVEQIWNLIEKIK